MSVIDVGPGCNPEVDKVDDVADQGPGLPIHWGDDWSRMPVYRAGLVDHKGEEQPRKPLFPLPETIKGDGWQAKSDRDWSTRWWGGQVFTLDEAWRIVDGELTDYDRELLRSGAFGRYPSAAKDIAHMPWLDDMFVIDCDMKTYFDSPDGTPFVAVEGKPNSATRAPTYSRYGLDDLYREAAARGMKAEELDDYLDSWTERTKSCGCHIVLKQHPVIRIERTMHHRHEYRVDVLASVNNWRGCYPSPGYTVLKDRPVKVAAKRLVELLVELNNTLDPVGGKRMKKAEEGFEAVHRRTYARTRRGHGAAVIDLSLMDRWRTGVLRVVHEANQLGNWNKKIYWAAHRYEEGRWPVESAERDILAAAQPWDDREERNAIATIRSAYRGVAR
ncbi:hypothetical protein [Streptomyces albicerus]|uniref:hypothetical protein n=1 Tax=Streptomyces albicerus TaxID=2569859 RepID=UPI00124B15B4|nr:hypothetical protein [Streptomyces albicerus]